jgi:hypothetical protein
MKIRTCDNGASLGRRVMHKPFARVPSGGKPLKKLLAEGRYVLSGFADYGDRPPVPALVAAFPGDIDPF